MSVLAVKRVSYRQIICATCNDLDCKQDKYKMYHISLLWQCWALSVERWEQFTMRAFPWKLISQGFFSLSVSMKGVLQNKNHSIWLRNYSSVHDLILEARWVQRKSTSYYIDRRIHGNSICESIKLLRYYSVQTQLNFNNSRLALNLSRNRLWPSGILPRRSTSK